MTYEEKVKRIHNQEKVILKLRSRLLFHFERSAHVSNMEILIGVLNKAYCTLNQLRQRYRIYNNSILI